jgi:hypothetical protein
MATTTTGDYYSGCHVQKYWESCNHALELTLSAHFVHICRVLAIDPNLLSDGDER